MNSKLDNNPRIIITRPAAQSDRLSAMIDEAGGQALRVPALEIAPVNDPDAARLQFERLDSYDILIFISPNAARFSRDFFDPKDLDAQLTIAIGTGTEQAMEMVGIPCAVTPEDSFSSEALLKLPVLENVDGKSILIVRGVGGLTLLAQELAKRNATVAYAEVYQRQIPADSKAELAAVFADGGADALTANSVETLTNIITLSEGLEAPNVKALQLFTGSPRVVQKAQELNFETPAILAGGPDDQSLMDALLSWANESENTAAPATESTSEGTDDNVDTTKPEQDAAKSEPVKSAEVLPPPQPTIERKRKSGGALSWLAMLTALLAVLASGWTWWRTQQIKPPEVVDIQVPTADEILAQIRPETERNNQQLRDQIKRQQSSVDDAVSSQDELASGLRSQKRSVESLTDELQDMEESISAMRGVSASVRNTWVRAEAEYFLQTANTRLQLAGDVHSATQALRAADERIVALGDPSLTPVRAILSEELFALESLPAIDIEGIALTLNSLAAKVSDLKLVNDTPDNYATVKNADVEGAGWQRAKNVVSNAWSNVIRVSPVDDSRTALLAPEQSYFLYRNLELQLQAARIATLQLRQNIYDDSIATALVWLESYYDANDAGVAAMQERLKELQQQKITRSLPDISGSLNLIRSVAPGRSTSGSTNSPAGAPAPVTPETEQ